MKKHVLTRLIRKDWEILQVSWTAKKTNEWVRKKAGVKRELLDTVKARKLAYYGHTMRKQGSCLEKEIIQGTMPGACRRGRPRTACIGTSRRGQDSPWKSQSEWQRTGINGESTSMVWPTLGSRTAKEQNGTGCDGIAGYATPGFALHLLYVPKTFTFYFLNNSVKN